MSKLVETVRNCTKCNLCNNQLPLVQECNNADIFWVGLSAVKTQSTSDIPLSPITNSGKLIESIEFLLPSVSFYKTNLVKCLPLNKNKIRYPSSSEMKNCFFHLENEIDFFEPKMIFLLGKQVATFVLKEYGVKDISLNDSFNYETFQLGGNIFVPIHHPSFILIYKRKKLEDYIDGIKDIILSNSNNSEINAQEFYQRQEFQTQETE